MHCRNSSWLRERGRKVTFIFVTVCQILGWEGEKKELLLLSDGGKEQRNRQTRRTADR